MGRGEDDGKSGAEDVDNVFRRLGAWPSKRFYLIRRVRRIKKDAFLVFYNGD